MLGSAAEKLLAALRDDLKAGVLREDGIRHRTITGTAQGGTLAPLPANIALSVPDEHITQK